MTGRRETLAAPAFFMEPELSDSYPVHQFAAGFSYSRPISLFDGAWVLPISALTVFQG
jgi:hypothetical protein